MSTLAWGPGASNDGWANQGSLRSLETMKNPYVGAELSGRVPSSHPVRKKQLIDFKATRGLPSNPNHRKDTDLTGADSGVVEEFLAR